MITPALFMRDQQIYYPHQLISSPEVSIIMPTYCRNTSGLLKRAIDSVLQQTFKQWELIIVDDGSSDGSAATIRQYQQQDHRVIHIRHAYQCGLPAIRVNEGIMLARGNYIAYQFDDDMWHPNMLNLLLRRIRKLTTPALVYGKAHAFPPDGRLIGQPFAAGSSRLMDANFIANNAVMHSKECGERFGLYDTHIVMRRVCDWMLWQRWSQWLPFRYVNHLISQVAIGEADAIGMSSPYDLLTYRIFNGLNRGDTCHPSRWLNTAVDDLSWTAPYRTDYRKQVEEQHIIPWREKTKHAIDNLLCLRNPSSDEQSQETYSITQGSISNQIDGVGIKRSLLVSKMHYDPSIDITFQHFNQISNPYFQSFYVPLGQLDSSYMHVPDVIAFHRACYDFSVHQHQVAQQLGKPVMYVMDDDFLHLHEVSPEFSYLAPGADYYNQLLQHLQEADLAVAYSALTADSIRPYNPRVISLKTNLPSRYLNRNFPPDRQDLSTKRPIRIGYTGGNSRIDEFKELWKAFEDISYKYGHAIEFVFWGLNPHLFGNLKSPIRYEPFTYSYYEYLGRLSDLELDLAVAPLDDSTRAKAGKCPIKYLEYTAAGVVGIYSDAVPYQIIQHGVTGWKAGHTVQDWFEAMDQMIQMPYEERKSMWEAALKEVRNNYSTEHESITVAAALDATILHQRLRPIRSADGKPYLLWRWNESFYSEHLMWKTMLALREYAIEPILEVGAACTNEAELRLFVHQYQLTMNTVQQQTTSGAEGVSIIVTNHESGHKVITEADIQTWISFAVTNTPIEWQASLYETILSWSVMRAILAAT